MLKETTRVGALEITLQQSPKQLRTMWHGDADARDLGAVLREYFEHVAALAESSDRSVGIDVTSVRFMSSSCIGFVTGLVRSLARRNIHVELVYNTAHPWQILSSRCMKTVFAKTSLVTVTERS